jgi:phosphoribosylaminoimidazole carboxylase/phosphoribosylaminoimidazole-succinocarboxamide synthase
MRRNKVVVFEVIEKEWEKRDCEIIEMKIEFGVEYKGDIMVDEVIESD